MKKVVTYKRSKKSWTTELAAQNDVCIKVDKNDLITAHTNSQWVWKTKTPEVEVKEAYKINKTACKENVALQYAINYFNTFENNLQSNHSELQWVFLKIRS